MTIEEFDRLNPVHYVRPLTCWCGAPNRAAFDHECGECPDHCELAAHRDGRPSPRATAEVTITRPGDITGARGRQPSRVVARNAV